MNERNGYLIWYTNQKDGVVTTKGGRVPAFRHVAHLRRYACRRHLVLMRERPLLHDLDKLQLWLGRPRQTSVDCVVFLSAWNLFVDVASSVRERKFLLAQKQTKRIYMKLFWGNNLPAVTPVGKRYVPRWSKREMEVMQNILGIGLSVFRNRLISIRGIR